MFNNFGASEAGVLLKFTLGGYTPTASEFGGTPTIAAELADKTREVVQAMPAQIRDAIQNPDLMLIETRAAASQTTATLRLIPVVTGKVHIWAGPPQVFTSRPMLMMDPWRDGSFSLTSMGLPTPPGSIVELPEAGFTVNLTTGVVTLATALNRNDQVYATYQTDIEHASFSLPSLSDLTILGVAASIGAKVYPQASSQWQYVSDMKEAWLAGLEGLATGKWIPAELRTIQWWQAPEPNAAEGLVGSVRKLRS